MQMQRGFTLLELMLVLFLIAISTSVVMLSGRQMDSEEKNALALANQLNSIMTFSVDKAVIEGNPLGILFSADGWQILQPVPDKNNRWRWSLLPRDARFPQSGLWDRALQIDFEPFSATADTPQVVILPDGQISLFSLTLRSRETQRPLFNLRSSGALPLHLSPMGKNRK